MAILGGAKISGKILVIDNLLDKVDALLIGGGMANTFFKALGNEVGDSLVEDDSLATAQRLVDRGGSKLVLPVDVTVADSFSAEGTERVSSPYGLPTGSGVILSSSLSQGPV